MFSFANTSNSLNVHGQEKGWGIVYLMESSVMTEKAASTHTVKGKTQDSPENALPRAMAL